MSYKKLCSLYRSRNPSLYQGIENKNDDSFKYNYGFQENNDSSHSSNVSSLDFLD